MLLIFVGIYDQPQQKKKNVRNSDNNVAVLTIDIIKMLERNGGEVELRTTNKTHTKQTFYVGRGRPLLFFERIRRCQKAKIRTILRFCMKHTRHNDRIPAHSHKPKPRKQ